MLHLWQLRSYLATFQWLSSSQQERKQTINHCSSFEALSSPAFRPSSRWVQLKKSISQIPFWFIAMRANPSTSSAKWSFACRQRTTCKKDWIKRWHRKEKKKEKKKKQRKELLNEVVKSTGFPKTHSSLLFRAGVKRRRMPLKEQMIWNFYYVYLHSLLHIK